MKQYTVVSNEQTTASTLLITLALKDKESPLLFRPGQYAAIGFHRHRRPTPMRCFSIASSPLDAHTLQFGLRNKGHFTHGVAGLQTGDEVTVEGPFGGFVLDDYRDRKTVMLAGGIGITPFMSMIRYAADTRLSNELRLIYSCATQDDIPFFDEIVKLEKSNPHFKVAFFIGKGPTDRLNGEIVFSGRISPELLDTVTSQQYFDKTYFICGPPPFMRGMTQLLKDKGTPIENIMTEAFSQGPNRQTGKIRSWPINIYVLGALGTVAASFVVMVVDVFKTLPAASISLPYKAKSIASTNSRQDDLDKLVNGLPVLSSTAPASSATNPKTITETVTEDGGVITTTSSSPSTATTSTATPTTTTTTAPAPAPAPTPVCTTSPSGVTTCK